MGARRRVAASLIACALVIGACSSERESSDLAPSEATPGTTGGPTTSAGGLPALSAPPTASPDTRPTRTTTTTRPPRRTTTTTTTLVPVRSAANPRCVVRIREGDSLFVIAEAADRPGVTITSLQRENRIRNPDRIEAGDLLDICTHNGINDITGRERVPPRRPPRRNQGNG